MVGCPLALQGISTVTMAPTSVGLATAFGQHDVVLLPSLIPRDTMRGVVVSTTVLQQQVTDALSGLC